MTLIDAGTGTDREFLHEEYHIHGEGNMGRFGTHSENMRMLYVTPILSVKTRQRITNRDTHRRNETHIYLFNENNIQIRANVLYNHANEDLSISFCIQGNNGKKPFVIPEEISCQ